MATYTSNYAWTKPGGNDQVDISVLNGNLDSQDTIMHKAFTNMAQAFSAASTYAVGDIVLYDNVLYKCHTAVTVAGAWTGSTNWQVYKLSEGGGGGLTLGETSSTAYRGDRGKTAYDHSQTTGNPHGTTASDVGLGNVPNVSTNDQTPTFTEASTRNNIASGEKLSVILGKIQKFFNDLKTVAFSGNASDLNYDNTDSGLSATDVQGAVDELRQADNIMTSDGVTSVEDALDDVASGLGDVILKSLATSNREFRDFDTVIDGGLYLSANYKTFNGAPQSTKDDSCVLLVLNNSPYIVQICISTYQFDKIYIRYNTTGSWSTWKSISLA